MLAALLFVSAAAGLGADDRSSSPSLRIFDGRTDSLPPSAAVGLGSARPQFSWALAAGARNVTQRSYRLVVATTQRGAAGGTDIFADTGIVHANRSTLVDCGTALTAGRAYWWSVTATADDGSQSGWLAAQRFTVGLQTWDDWSTDARFIGLRDAENRTPGKDWIAECPWLRSPTFELSAAELGDIRAGRASALLYVASVGFHEPLLNGRALSAAVLSPSVSDLGKRVLARTYDVQELLVQGTNAVGLWIAPGWASLSWPQGSYNLTKAPLALAELRFVTAGGTLLRPTVVSSSKWRSRHSNIEHRGDWKWANYGGESIDHTQDVDSWADAAFDDSHWAHAAEYGLPMAQPLFKTPRDITPESLEPVRVVEEVPAVKVEECRARNAPRSDCPTASGFLGGVRRECSYHCTPADLLNLTCANGGVITKIQFAMFGAGPFGECAAFHKAGCAAKNAYAVVAAACLNRSSCSIMPSITTSGGPFDPACSGIVKTLAIQAGGCSPKPEPAPAPPANATRCYVITMEKLFNGMLNVDQLPAAAGANITLQYSSTAGVDEEWTAQDSVLVSGSNTSFRNRFNSHEFQFVTIKGLSGPPKLSSITGLRIRNSRERVGAFESSDLMLNHVYNATVSTIEGLQQFGVIVDCPNRERFGYGGDSNSHIEFVMRTYSATPLMNKWLRDWRDVAGQPAQDIQPATPVNPAMPSRFLDGNVPNSAPTFDGAGGPAWGALCLLLPYRLYLSTGDVTMLKTAYPTMRGYLFFLLRHSANGTHVLKPGTDAHSSFDFLGDWQSPHGNGGGVESLLFNNAHFVYVLRMAVDIAAAIGHTADGATYAAAADAVGAATHTMFFNATSARYLSGRQTHQLAPLISGLVPRNLRPHVVAALVDEIVVNQKGHLDTGTFGTYFLWAVLSSPAVQRDDLLLQMITEPTYPGYGYHIAQGCTTWPETWDCAPVAGGTSRMHSTHNGIGLWFYQGALGIQPDRDVPGFALFTVRPAFGCGLAWARGAVHTPHGPVVVSWWRDTAWPLHEGYVEFNVTVPGNSRATVYLPAASAADVQESGHPAAWSAVFMGVDGNSTMWSVGSGKYAFAMRSGVSPKARQ